jgi:hypothetical protein
LKKRISRLWRASCTSRPGCGTFIRKKLRLERAMGVAIQVKKSSVEILMSLLLN